MTSEALPEDLIYRFTGPHDDCELTDWHTHPTTEPRTSQTIRHGLVIKGVVYDVRYFTADHGGFHSHRSAHPDGSPGLPDHHHHDFRCNRRQALLLPVATA